MTYLDDFLAAERRTQAFDLSLPSYRLDPDPRCRYLTKKIEPEFERVAQAAVGDIGVEELVAQCFSIHHRLQLPLAHWLDVPVIYTLGWIETSNGGFFKSDDEEIRRLLALRKPSLSLNLHAWLTLPSMEVIDLSLATTFAVMQGLPESQWGRVIAKHADDMLGMTYKPMLVGDDLLRRLGTFIET